MKLFAPLAGFVALVAAAPSDNIRRDTSCTITAGQTQSIYPSYGLDAPDIVITAFLEVSCTGDYSVDLLNTDMPNSKIISGSDTGLPGDINWTIEWGQPGIDGCTAQFNGGDVISGSTSSKDETAFAVTIYKYGCSVSFGFYGP